MQILTYPFSKQDQETVSDLLKKKKATIVYPTETYYALGCSATDSEAVEKIYKLKQRSTNLPLLVLIDSWEMLDRYVVNLNTEKRNMLEDYWPGALTAILEAKGNDLANELNYQKSTLGFRMTSSPIAKKLIEITGVPLVGTSANRSSEKEAANCVTARQYFQDKVDLYIDGGASPGSAPSTLIDLTGKEIKIVREGMVKLKPNYFKQ